MLKPNSPRRTAPGRQPADNSDIRSSGCPAALPFKPSDAVASTPETTLPAGYRLVDGGMHMISNRDIVFFGGALSFWQPARRAGESGGLRMFSVARAVAAPFLA